jgi:UDP-glucuronate 4-epimerase
MSNKKTILITGVAGFIGYHLSEAILKLDHYVIGLDNINNYYDINLKFSRLKNLGFDKEDAKVFNSLIKSKIHGSKIQFIRMDLNDSKNLKNLFEDNNIDLVCNLAAQAGVRYSLENPKTYIDSNIVGFLNILECCRHNNIRRLVYASSSSVYGESDKIPFTELDNVDNPISLYAASKKSNELMAYAYSHLFGFETIGLRFFTVYGPWGRPDMALFLFTDAILNNRPIDVFNKGILSRDFTYIDDIINGVVKTLFIDSKDKRIYKLYNIGSNSPVKLLDFISVIENYLNIKAKKRMLPMQLGDVHQTFADINKLINDYNYKPNTTIEEGVKSFINWYKNYYLKI